MNSKATSMARIICGSTTNLSKSRDGSKPKCPLILAHSMIRSCLWPISQVLGFTITWTVEKYYLNVLEVSKTGKVIFLFRIGCDLWSWSVSSTILYERTFDLNSTIISYQLPGAQYLEHDYLSGHWISLTSSGNTPGIQPSPCDAPSHSFFTFTRNISSDMSDTKKLGHLVPVSVNIYLSPLVSKDLLSCLFCCAFTDKLSLSLGLTSITRSIIAA